MGMLSSMNKVPIVILTYNLEEYVEDCLLSVLMQKTNFSFGILVSDDCSSDRTIQIIKKYQEKFPDKISFQTSECNTGNLMNTMRALSKVKTEYFAVLDGDDLWVGEDRLQHQVDFLDIHPDYMICSGQTVLLKNGNSDDVILPDNYMGATYTFEDYFKVPMLFHVSGLLLRNKIYANGLPRCYYEVVNTNEDCALRGEEFRRMIHLEKGPLYVLPEVVSCYRIHEKGIWSGQSSAGKAIESAIAANYFMKYYRNRYMDLQPYIRGYAMMRYRKMWEVIVNENYIFPEYKLNSKETRLLTSYLQDIRRSMDIIQGLKTI